ncbi:hypothetical protein GC088_13485 [Arthrobacter sp. JZ12]|uniref:hypothetical protein n=1 Tax=Arthrobacter sp. JZ12 TaxID=2654190 RepID=UPI002B466ADB|nr:hypothetical protein [Arthrobacter sp. JZ12]WRH25983.1 hypothetical protein GC088_13485 [Arthrobacter sp. JZ12]
MDPSSALNVVEIVLRNAIRFTFSSDWVGKAGAPSQETLAERQATEVAKCKGAVVSNDLLDYTMTYELTDFVEKNWQHFKPIFLDFGRIREFFRIVNAIRNTIAHNRSLLPFEEHLILGIAGQLANQVSLFLGSADLSGHYYPLIESARDSFGQEGAQWKVQPYVESFVRVDVGQRVVLKARAVSARGKGVTWYVSSPSTGRSLRDTDGIWTQKVGDGEDLEFAYTFSEKDIREDCALRLILVADSKYHRYGSEFQQTDGPFDDSLYFYYSVNPPLEE